MSTKTHPKSEDLGSSVIDAANNLVAQITELVGPAPALSANDVRRSLKLRKGGASIIPTVAALSEQFGLNVPSHPTATMLAKSKQAESLIPLQQKMASALKQVNDVIFAAQSESWESATVHYTMQKRLSGTNGDLEAAIAPVQQFFARRNAAVLAEEKETKAVRKATKAAQAADKANAAVAKIRGAKASASPVTTAPAAAPAPAPTTPTASPTGTTTPPATTSPAQA
jgi:hypothetical protein